LIAGALPNVTLLLSLDVTSYRSAVVPLLRRTTTPGEKRVPVPEVTFTVTVPLFTAVTEAVVSVG
jgi:hypothetical protein